MTTNAPDALIREDVRYFIFDVESVADGRLISQVRYSKQEEDPLDERSAIALYQDQLMEQFGSTFIPFTYQVPTAVVIGKVDKFFRLRDLVSLDEPEYRPEVMTQHFWEGWEAYGRPTWVSFNGRGFDIPLMELAAYRYGISVESWFQQEGPSYTQPRNRYNVASHFDLQEFVTNFGATRFNGGLDLAAKMLQRPGKMHTQGDEVQAMYDAGRLREISDYCRCDVLDTYFIFLRTMVVHGKINREYESELAAATEEMLTQKSDQYPVYSIYLDRCRELRES